MDKKAEKQGFTALLLLIVLINITQKTSLLTDDLSFSEIYLTKV